MTEDGLQDAELYDITETPDPVQDLSSSHPELTQQLLQQMQNALKEYE